MKSTRNGKFKNGMPRYAYTFEFTFNDRLSYSVHRADWRVRMKAYVDGVKKEKSEERALVNIGNGRAACASHNARVYARSAAHALLAERLAMKEEARRQYAARMISVPAVLEPVLELSHH